MMIWKDMMYEKACDVRFDNQTCSNVPEQVISKIPQKRKTPFLNIAQTNSWFIAAWKGYLPISVDLAAQALCHRHRQSAMVTELGKVILTGLDFSVCKEIDNICRLQCHLVAHHNLIPVDFGQKGVIFIWHGHSYSSFTDGILSPSPEWNLVRNTRLKTHQYP